VSYTTKIPQILREAMRDVRTANRISAERIAREAQANVARDTGRTAASVEALPTNEGYEVHVDFPGHLLEFGSVKMGARPFLVPAAEAERAAHERAVRRAYDS
jgi:hypothetical protein